MILPPARWQRVIITALLVLPLTLVAALSAPAWLIFPFLSESRRNTVIHFLGCLVDWTKAIVGPGQVGTGSPSYEPSPKIAEVTGPTRGHHRSPVRRHRGRLEG